MHRYTCEKTGTVHSGRVHIAFASSKFYVFTPLNMCLQIPLSALSPPDAKPGAVGGSFNSTTKVKMVPLPTIYSRHQYTYKGVRNVCLHTGRYTPSARNQPRTISHSLLNISTMQRKHLNHCETGVQKSKSLKKASEVVPHRIERAFYMNGESTQLFDRQDIPPEEVQALRTLALAQNTDLYFGKGISSRRAKRANRTIQDFETKLRLASEQSKDYGLEEMGIDAGRFSRASRTVTPGSPISEEPAQLNHLEKKRSSQRTFITQSQSKQQQ